jgi:hypothetical protein
MAETTERQERQCSVCEGVGYFGHPHDGINCNACKGTGWVAETRIAPQPTEDSRVAFEKWASDKHRESLAKIEKMRTKVGSTYTSMSLAMEWDAWQAALSTAPLAAAPSTVLTDADNNILRLASKHIDGCWNPDAAARFRKIIDRLSTKGVAPTQT